MEKCFFMSSKGPWLKGHSSCNRLPPQNVHYDLIFSVLTSHKRPYFSSECCFSALNHQHSEATRGVHQGI